MKQKELKKVIKLCDNIFYGKYLETGELKTRDELQNKIKKEVTETFIKFWGNEHAEYLTKKIENTKIHFVYQVDGLANSISNFLLKLKAERFNHLYNYKYNSSILFKQVADMLFSGFNPGEKLQKLISGNKVPLDLITCIQELELDVDEIIKNKTVATEAVNQIKKLASQYKVTSFSDNHIINKKLKWLEKFVIKTENKMYRQCRRKNINFYDAFYKNILGPQFDPLVKAMKLDESMMFMLGDEGALGLHANDSSDVYFAINPSDHTILHEFVHEVDNIGFEKGHFEFEQSFYSSELRQNQMFNEVINDYFASLMDQQRRKDGRPHMVCDNEFSSEYSRLFKIMGKFLDAYLPELKAVRLREYPAEEFMRIIGKKNFEKIALLCNEVIALKSDIYTCNMAKEDEMNLNDLVEESGFKFYGSLDFFVKQMQGISQVADKNLQKYLKRALNRQSISKKIDLFLRDQSQNLAEHLNKKPKLHKLAQSVTNVANYFNNLVEKRVLKKLKAPIQCSGLKDKDETSVKESEVSLNT